jgi:hypothetical protein
MMNNDEGGRMKAEKHLNHDEQDYQITLIGLAQLIAPHHGHQANQENHG